MPQFGRGGFRGGRAGGGRGGQRPQGRPPGRQAAGQGRAVATVERELVTGPLSLPHALTVKEFADLVGISPIDVIKELMKNGTMASINSVLDYDTAATIAIDLGYDVSEEVAKHEEPAVETSARRPVIEDAPETLRSRPPVVAVMGHVDHGKTSILDAIRKTNVAGGEAGGITQHLGAYQVEVQGRKVTFLDTPGHEAFTAMRARGAQTTDIAIVVVAADDGVMPQTREAINHVRAAGVPLIIALNKIDRPNANPDKVKQQLTDDEVVIEEYGGDVPAVPVSARTGAGLPELLDTILLVADVHDFKANPDRAASGIVLESRLDRSRGPVSTILVQRGTLRPGDMIVAGVAYGRVRALFDEHGNRMTEAGPSMPAGVLGLSTTPLAGEQFEVVPEDAALAIVEGRVQERHRAQVAPQRAVSLEELFQQTGAGTVRDLNVILKTDVQGSIDPLRNQLERLEGENVRVRVIHAAPGAITESDVNLAVASKGIILGFNVRPEAGAKNLADVNGVDIREYHIIYDVIDDIARALQGMQEERLVEVIRGHAEVRQLFKLGRRGVIAGCYLVDGSVTRDSLARIRRGKELVYEGKVASLRRFQEDIREVAEGYECGIMLDDYNAVEIGDVIELFAMERQSVPVRAR